MRCSVLSCKKAISEGGGGWWRMKWDAEPQSTENLQPQKPRSFPVANILPNLGLSLLLHIHNVDIRDSDLQTSLMLQVKSI